MSEAPGQRELKLKRLVEAGMLLNQSLTLDGLLTRIVEVAAHLLEARYVALGVLADDGVTLKSFITTGLTEAQKAAIGPLPTGKGILGAMLGEGRPLRLAHLNADPRSTGFPENHPPMSSFLGVPILWRGQVFGRLYCTEKLTADEFSLEDEEIATLLAAQAATAIENANLYEQARAASRLKSEFLANMSHELRTPMNSILGFTELVMNGTLGAVNDQQRSGLERVLRNARHLLELIDDVLDLAKIEAGKMTVVEEVLSPRVLIEGALATVEPLAAAKGLTLAFEGDALPTTVRGDEGKIRQIVLNLLSNAVKFTEAGAVTVTGHFGNGTWTVAIADTGVGIQAEDLAIIFEEFRQVDASTTRQAGGTGLGLAISRKMAILLGGDLTVSSSVGVGSTFTLTLPLWREQHPGSAVTIAQTPAAHPHPEGRLVLAIDDDPDVLALMTSRLKGSEFSVVTALGGQEGLKLAGQLKPDLITLDILMPDLDGWEVLRRLKSNPQLRHVPVVMMSIHDDNAMAFGMGAAECLVKPVSRERLIDVLGLYAPSGATAPILVVDDEPDARALVRDILVAAGYDVVEAADGREALAAIATRRPALVVLDLMMPELDGFAVLERLAADPALRELPVVVLTALALSPADEARLKEGTQLVLSKGATSTDELLEHLMGAMRRRLSR